MFGFHIITKMFSCYVDESTANIKLLPAYYCKNYHHSTLLHVYKHNNLLHYRNMTAITLLLNYYLVITVILMPHYLVTT